MSKVKKRSVPKLSAFARANAVAEALLDVTFDAKKDTISRTNRGITTSERVPAGGQLEVTAKGAARSRVTKKGRDVTVDLGLARDRVEVLFSAVGMKAEAVRRRLSQDNLQDQETPFSAMAGVRR